jgi:hypothetical protein
VDQFFGCAELLGLQSKLASQLCSVRPRDSIWQAIDHSGRKASGFRPEI